MVSMLAGSKPQSAVVLQRQHVYVWLELNSVCRHTDASLPCSGSKSKATDEGDTEDDVPFLVQEERRPLRARKTMQLQHVDNMLRDMRCDS